MSTSLALHCSNSTSPEHLLTNQPRITENIKCCEQEQAVYNKRSKVVPLTNIRKLPDCITIDAR